MKGDLPVRASASDIARFRLLAMGHGEPVGVDSQPAPRAQSECELELVGKAESAARLTVEPRPSASWQC